MYTPRPWEVEKDIELYGRYTILEAAKEQADWTDEGYRISDEEGDRRSRESEERNEGNRLLIQAAPDLYEAGMELIKQWDKGNLSSAIQKLAKAIYEATPALPGRTNL